MIDKDLLKRDSKVYAVGYNSYGNKECVKCTVVTNTDQDHYLLRLHPDYFSLGYYLRSEKYIQYTIKIFHISEIFDNKNACCNYTNC